MSKNVYQLIAVVAADMAQSGIRKMRKNQQQGYQFRSIDDVYNRLAPVLAKHGLVILPRCISRETVERVNKAGTILFSVVVEAEFDFVSSFDGSKHTVKTYGEAMDSADKATNKAMSAAYKYAAFQTFCIPTEGDNDADSTSHILSASGRRPAQPPAKAVAESLTAAEVSQIETLAAAIGKPIQDITTAFKVDELRDISRTAFDQIVRRLESAHSS